MLKHPSKNVKVNLGIEMDESIQVDGVSATATKFGESFRGIFRWQQSFFKLVIIFLKVLVESLQVSNAFFDFD
jgi:hypothetical protein